jgi:hypothetical protein
MKYGKNVPKKMGANKAHPAFNQAEVPLPLVPKKVTKEELEVRLKSKFKLYVNPNDEQDNTTCERYVYHIDGTEEVRIILQWKQDVEMVRKGMAISNIDTLISTTQGLCEGTAKQSYDGTIATSRNALTPGQVMTLEMHQQAVDAVIMNSMPYECLRMQKRYMRHYMRKPREMRMKEYVGHVRKMNKDELPQLPPFENGQSLEDTEIVDLVHHSLPREWQKKMIEQNFVPERSTMQALTDFCERIEVTDSMTSTGSNKRSRNGYENNSKSDSGESTKTGKYCKFHRSTSHNTDECRQRKFHDQKPAFKNKSWKKKADDAKASTTKELAMVLTKFARGRSDNKPGTKRAHKELASIEKEVEAFLATQQDEEQSDDSSDSDYDEEEANIVEEGILRVIEADIEEAEYRDARVQSKKMLPVNPNDSLGEDDIAEDDDEAIKKVTGLEDLDATLAEFQIELDDKVQADTSCDDEYEFE